MNKPNFKVRFNASRRAFAGVSLGALAATVLPTQRAQAQDYQNYPSKPIRLIVPSAAGGAPDVVCRILATELALALGQAIVVDNKPGAGGAIGMQELARATPDGYTLAYGNVVTLAINKSLYSKLPYNPDNLSSIALMGTVQNALVVRNSLAVNSVNELIAYAKKNPGKLTMGSAGNGTTGHLGGELFKSRTGTFIIHAPYRGSPMAIQDLLGGQIDLMFDNLSSIGPHIKAGRVRALGVSGKARSPLFPELPTIDEAGVKGYETTAWGGIVGPSGMPNAIIERLNRDINRVLASAAVKEKYKSLAFETMPSAPSLLMTMASLESRHWAEVVKRAGATVD